MKLGQIFVHVFLVTGLVHASSEGDPASVDLDLESSLKDVEEVLIEARAAAAASDVVAAEHGECKRP